MIKAVIFDMDGTMVSTEELWGDINTKLALEYGVVFDEIVHRQMMGKKDKECLTTFKDYFHLENSVEELITRRREMILEDIQTVKTCKVLYELLDLLERLDIKKAVATSAFKDFATKVLSTFDLERRFPVIITGDEIVKSKPDPEIFLAAATRLGVVPQDCLVLEDAENGVEAGYNAGMHIFAIPHSFSKDHDFSKATKVLASMLEIDEVLLKSL